jgi:hypothetical protein
MKMKSIALAVITAAVSIAWGSKGHRTIALIAEKHLTGNTKLNVERILQKEPIEDAATWPDEHRTEEDARWHFINLPVGLTRSAFDKQVKAQKGTLYTAYLQSKSTLQNASAPAADKQRALRFLIHLVGDAHQPMHVARADDKGGNTIQVRFDADGTNLHQLWDSRLIDHESWSESKMVAQYDIATPQQVDQWQKDDILQWLWESYQLSTELYQQVKPGQQISEAYYQKYIAVIHQRINQAGIRLAGELNTLYAKMPVTVAPTPARTIVDVEYLPVPLEKVADNIGKNAVITGKVYGTKDIGSLVLVNLGAAYPNQLLTVALKGKAKDLATGLEGKVIQVTGEIILFKGKPEIIVSDTGDVQIK